MVRLSVLYPATPGSTFDWNYYLGPHLVLARRLLLPTASFASRLIAASAPSAGTPSHHHAIGHLYFESMLQLDTALAATAPELIADQRKYYTGETIVQVSEVVPSLSTSSFKLCHFDRSEAQRRNLQLFFL